MIRSDDPPPPSHRTTIVLAALTAGVTTLATGLVTWALDAVRARLGPGGDPPDRGSK